MRDPENFYFAFPQNDHHQPPWTEDTEPVLLARLHNCPPEARFECLWDLVEFYSQTGRQPIALQYVARLRELAADNPELLARLVLATGQLMEQIHDFESAAACYAQGLALEPTDTPTWYLIHNNLGYCLNQLGRPAEAEPYCRTAIDIDSNRHNAYKNLGIALEAQARWPEAARSYIHAVQANAADGRACRLLEQLLAAHPIIATEWPEVTTLAERCRVATQTVADLRQRPGDPPRPVQRPSGGT